MRITPPPSPRATMTSAPATPAQPSSRMIRPKAMRMLSGIWSEKGVRLAQQMQVVGPCVPVGIHLKKAEVGPISGPTYRLSHLDQPRRLERKGHDLR